MFLLVLFGPMAIRATTCGPATVISTAMYLYDDCPAHAGATLLTEQSDEYDCSVIEYDVHTPASYWIVVEGADDTHDGTFELRVTCTHVPTPSPTGAPVSRAVRRRRAVVAAVDNSAPPRPAATD